MYNSIYPININYSNQYRKASDKNSAAQNSQDNQPQHQDSFPNGTKVAIDYTKGQINISQVLTDFRSTIVAINAPSDIQDEVSIYLNLVEKESYKENPSRDIIISNLRNASRISDDFIARSLNKPSKVVEGWIDALFLQKINLKADPNEVNPDFLLEFPKNAQERIDKSKQSDLTLSSTSEEIKLSSDKAQSQEVKFQDVISNDNNAPQELALIDNDISSSSEEDLFEEDEKIEIQSEIELSNATHINPQVDETQSNSQANEFSPINSFDTQAKDILLQARKMPQTNEGDTQALNLLNEALGLLENANANPNIKAAIHLERGKIFDNYDYVDYALRDYFEATKATELNLKAQAYYKSGTIYDEFNEFSPALDGYLSSVAYSGEADNIKAQTLVLSRIESLYTKQYDIEMANEFGLLAQENADLTDNIELIAQTHSNTAQNLQYLGEHKKALSKYKSAIQAFSVGNSPNYDDMAYNYEQAAQIMRQLGNFAKANKLQAKADLYRQKAPLEHNQLAQAS